MSFSIFVGLLALILKDVLRPAALPTKEATKTIGGGVIYTACSGKRGYPRCGTELGCRTRLAPRVSPQPCQVDGVAGISSLRLMTE